MLTSSGKKNSMPVVYTRLVFWDRLWQKYQTFPNRN